MASLKEHASDCYAELGKGWHVVHRWLDELARIYWPWMGHRVHRHNKEGVEEVRAKWGDEAARAAEIHILKDEGLILSKKEMYERYELELDEIKKIDSQNIGMKNEGKEQG